MRKIIDWLVLLVLVFGAWYQVYKHKVEIRAIVRNMRVKLLPCTAPILYSIGSVDPRFNLPLAALAGDLQEAEAVWEQPSRSDLFRYVRSGGDITVNLVYDERQAATDKLNAMGYDTAQTRAAYDELKAKYDALSPQVDAEQVVHRTKLADYKRKEAAYNAKVGQLNRRRSATAAEQQRLKARRQVLERDFAVFQALENGMNANIDTLNALATALNQLIVQLNINVEQYNRQGTAMGQFEEGLYKITGGIQSIDIYEYANRMRLVRVLAHEMGHALGLEHTADSGAIMYRVNLGDNLTVTSTDIRALNKVCTSGMRGIRALAAGQEAPPLATQP